MGKWSPYAKKIGIYQIRNVLNGMIYIGSSFDIAARWREHKYNLRMNKHRNQHLQNAYNKYGKDAFVYEILEILSEDQKELQFEREQYWIDLKEACNKKKGYNIQKEVLVVPKATKKVACLETKEVFNSLEEAGRVKGISSGSISCCCNKRKLKQTGGYHWRFYDEYVNMTEEEIEKTIFDLVSYPFVCLEDGKVYKSWRELPYKKGLIHRCCKRLAKGEYATCYGRHYMFLNDYKKLSEGDIKRIIERKRKQASSGQVVCLETNVIYENANKAAIALGSSDPATILRCCNKRAVLSHGFHWLFKDEYEQLSRAQIDRYLNKSPIDSYAKPVVCLETGKIYHSQIEAATDTKTSNHMINKTCKCGGYNTSKKSLHFVFLEDYEKMTREDIDHILSAIPKCVRKVKCVETGEVFNSVTEAAKSVGSETSNISKCCKRPKHICKGYHWEYV